MKEFKEKMSGGKTSMLEDKNNIKKLSKDEVIALSNTEKRIAFLESYKEWGVWLEIPELNVKIFKAEFPTGEILYVTEYRTHSYLMKDSLVAACRFVKPGGVYGQYADVRSDTVNKLKDLKMKYCEEKKR